MKIEIKNNRTQFEMIPIGSLFAYPYDSYSENDIYMSTDEHCIDNNKVNAVCLCDGFLHEFRDDDDVRLINNAKITIE